MALTDLQRTRLIKGVNTLPINTVLSYFLTGEITFKDVPDIIQERKEYIEKQINSQPNPNEQKEWADIEKLSGNPSRELLNKIEAYVRQWEGNRPVNNHVDEARALYNCIEGVLAAQAEQVERADWEKINVFSQTDLLGYLNKYPNTVHKAEIDDNVWNLLNKENVQELQNYKILFPTGNHIMEAGNLLNSIVEWNNVKSTDDLFVLNDYLKGNPDTPFMQQAQILMMGLKQREKETMRNHPNDYEVSRLMNLLKEGIVTEKELIFDGIVTKNVLETLRYTDIKADLPDIRKAIESSHAECKDGYTDVFFFGVPSTGKTCVLMGMSRSNSLHVNLAAGGGDYASALQQYTDVGVTVPRTPGTFVTTLEATISSKTHENTVHKINLVEMSGEEFAFGIANNPEHIFTFEEMGSGATKLLKNDNRKVFFLIIDPTANVVRINREIIDGYDEQTGAPITHLEYCVVNQRTLIQKMVNLFEASGNAEIMKKVDSIHIIMTKSDTLGDPVEREEKAYKIFQEKFGGDILEPLIELSKEYNINAHTKFHPKLYTFSLGTFYIGGLYEYEQNDSNRLVKAIRNSTRSLKKKTWWDRLKETVNK